MNLKGILVVLSMLLIASVVFAMNLDREQRASYNDCKKNCSTQKNLDKRMCNEVADQCRASCGAAIETCRNTSSSAHESCLFGCQSITAHTSNNASNLTDQELKLLQYSCKRNCSKIQGQDRKNCSIDLRLCTQSCQQSKNECKRTANTVFIACKDNCLSLAMNFNLTNQTSFNQTEKNDTMVNDTNSDRDDEDHNDKIFCRDRSQNCLAIFDPVCSNRKETFSNGCVACAKERTVWYTAGPCE